jgi:hypothetical protein
MGVRMAAFPRLAAVKVLMTGGIGGSAVVDLDVSKTGQAAGEWE